MTTMSRLEFLTELNQRLLQHPAYQPGMEFVFFPPGALPDEATGYDWRPREVAEPMTAIAMAAACSINVLPPSLERDAALPAP